MAVLMGGVVSLLIFGTQIFDWYWIAALAVASVAFGGWRIRRRLAGEYALARMADRKLALHDSLSTAWFFGQSTGGGSPLVQSAQRELAKAQLSTADPKSVVPFAVPRGLYALGALAALAFGMMVIRYGSYQGLSLRVPVTPAVTELLRKTEALNVLAEVKRPKDPTNPNERWQDTGIALDPDDSDRADGDNRGLTVAENRDSKSSQGTKRGESGDSVTVEKIEQQGQGAEEASGTSESEAGEQSSAGQGTKGNQESGPPREGNQQRAPNRQAAAAQSNQPGANSSLMSRMRDAMSNLLSKLNSRSQPGGRQQGASGEKGTRQGQQQATRQSGNPAAAREQSEGRDGGQMQDGNEGDPGQSAQQGRGQDTRQQSADRRGSANATSGAGKEDGEKDLAAAQQMAAMGKISEILGRRSQNVSGDITVEVSSGRQQLRTAYSQQNAQHMEAAGEIHRDEVPMALQAYVQQYFEQIRKTAPRPRQR